MKFAIYTMDTGAIVQMCWTPDVGDVVAILQAGQACLEVANEAADDTHYVLNEQAIHRPTMVVSVSGTVLSGLPSPGVIKIGQANYPYTGSTVELEFDQPGAYTVKVEAWPYLDKEFTLEN